MIHILRFLIFAILYRHLIF